MDDVVAEVERGLGEGFARAGFERGELGGENASHASLGLVQTGVDVVFDDLLVGVGGLERLPREEARGQEHEHERQPAEEPSHVPSVRAAPARNARPVSESA